MPRRTHCGPAAVLALTVALLAAPATGQEADGRRALEVVYLGNEGFFLEAGGTGVLVDALFGDGLFGYDVVAPEERRKLESATAPFDGVVLALASHVHGDHFSAPAMAAFLRASPATRFISTDQAVRKLLAYDTVLADRAQGVSPTAGEPVRSSAGDVRLTAFNLHHGGGEIRNLGLLIEICGVTVLHIGDTETSAAEMQAAGLQDLRPDIALLPGWYLRPGRWLTAIDQVIRPRRIVAMHLPTREAPPSYFWGGVDSREELARAILDQAPDAFVPLATGDRISVDCRQLD